MTTTAQAPAPELAIDGPRAVLTGVRFTWSLRCPWCRRITEVVAEGTVEAGLSVSGSKKTCRWYEKNRPGRLTVPACCSYCGQDGAFSGYPSREATAIAHSGTTLPLLNQVWASIRAAYPAEVKLADEANLRTLGKG